MRISRRMGLAALGLALLAVGASATPAGASAGAKQVRTGSVTQGLPVPAGFASWTDLLRVQEKMNAAADRIVTTAHKGATDSGFAGVVAAPENQELRVYWKGQAPASVTDSARDVRVRVLPAAYSERELQAAAARLLATNAFTSVGPNTDGSGLTVGVAATNALAAPNVTAAGVPVTVQTGVAPRAATRWNDSPPWWGGGAYRNANLGSGCSTGFAVFHGGVARMLSAGHCGDVGQFTTDPTGEGIGTIISDSNFWDTLIINGSSGGRVFNNDPALNEFSNPVIGAVNTFAGNWVCTSGAYSGTRCSIQVRATGLCINIGYTVCGQVQAEQVQFTDAVGQGDSGGPVEVVNPADTTQVYAAGTNTAIDGGTQTACAGYVTTGRICAWRMYYENIFSGMSAVGASSVVLG